MIRRRIGRLLLVALLTFSAPVAAVAQPAGAKIKDDAKESGGSKYPVGQYFIALLFGSLALAAILRSSRRGWSSQSD